MFYGYCRVSSKGQLENNSLVLQQEEIQAKYPGAKIELEQFTGITTERPVLGRLINALQPHDTLIVTKLDRLARNVNEGIQLIQYLFDKNIAVHVLNVGLLENTSMGRFFLTTLLAVAELERSMIIERTQSGKAIAKQHPGFSEGRPKKFTVKQINHALALLKNNSYKQVEELTGISKSTLIRAKNNKVMPHTDRY